MTKKEILERVYSDNKEVHEKFSDEFGPEIEDFSERMLIVFDRFDALQKSVPLGEREGQVQMFLYAAINALLTSFHLMVSGLSIPAGNLMRQYGESVAMALLCSHRKISTYDKFAKDPDQFPVHKSLEFANRQKNRNLLDLDPQGWKRFQGITAFFNKYSHPSALSVATLRVFDKPGKLALGGEFDSEKLDVYREEIQNRTSGCDGLGSMIGRAEEFLRLSKT